MHPAWLLRSAWAWRCPQRKAKRSLGGVGLPGIAIGVGGEGARDLDLILVGVLNPGDIAGGAQAAANIANGGNGAGRAVSHPISQGTRWLVRLSEHRRSRPAAASGASAGRRRRRWRCAEKGLIARLQHLRFTSHGMSSWCSIEARTGRRLMG